MRTSQRGGRRSSKIETSSWDKVLRLPPIVGITNLQFALPGPASQRWFVRSLSGSPHAVAMRSADSASASAPRAAAPISTPMFEVFYCMKVLLWERTGAVLSGCVQSLSLLQGRWCSIARLPLLVTLIDARVDFRSHPLVNPSVLSSRQRPRRHFRPLCGSRYRSSQHCQIVFSRQARCAREDSSSVAVGLNR
jgi:hypothetical protein